MNPVKLVELEPEDLLKNASITHVFRLNTNTCKGLWRLLRYFISKNSMN